MDTKIKLDVLNVIIEKTIEDVILHPTKLTLLWKSSPSMEYDERLLLTFGDSPEDFEYKKDLLNYMINRITKHGWDSKILNKKKLIMYSKQVLEVRKSNSDCVDKFGVDDFLIEINNETGITLKDFTECCYRLKALKYNYFNELLMNLKLIEETEEGYVVEIIFKLD
jgi:hypothetical protein